MFGRRSYQVMFARRTNSGRWSVWRPVAETSEPVGKVEADDLFTYYVRELGSADTDSIRIKEVEVS